MNIQEMIDKLNLIEDKSLKCVTSTYGEQECHEIEYVVIENFKLDECVWTSLYYGDKKAVYVG